MKNTITILLAASAVTCLFSSCAQETVGVMHPRRSVEEVERTGQDIRPNLNHGQHAAGANAVDYSNPGHRSRILNIPGY